MSVSKAQYRALEKAHPDITSQLEICLKRAHPDLAYKITPTLVEELWREVTGIPLSAQAQQLNCITRSRVKLKEHQIALVEHLLHHRGAIAVHSTGLGKTLLAIAASQCILDETSIARVLVLTPLSLQENFRKEMVKYGMDPDDSRYTFSTFDKFARRFSQGKEQCNKNTFLIIDEAHNFRTQIVYRRGSLAQGKRAKFAVDCAKRVGKVLLLTATPIVNYSHDIINLLALARGETPLSKKKFEQLLQNPAALARYTGCIFSFRDNPHDANYPTSTEHFVRIPMTRSVYREYRNVEETEMSEKSGLFFRNPWLFFSGLRQATNAISPCLKCQWAIDKIKEGQKTLVYSSWVRWGIKHLQSQLEEEKIPFTEVFGGMSKADRDAAVKKFNSNAVKVLFITKAGGEGLDLKGVRNVIILDSVWNRPSVDQIIGRAIRYKSHFHLPKSQQHVDIYHLILVKPLPQKRDISDRTESADEYLQLQSYEKNIASQKFMAQLRSLSLEKRPNLCNSARRE